MAQGNGSGNGEGGRGLSSGALAPPHNLEAEQSVLGAVLLSDRAMYRLVIDDGLRPEHFYRDRHRAIYSTMLALYDRSEPVDAITVTEHLRQTGELEDVGGPGSIQALVGAVEAPGNVRHYAGIVRDNALLRRLLNTAYEIQANVHGREGAPRDLVEWAEKAMLEVGQDDSQKDFQRIDDVLHRELEKLHKLSEQGQAMTGTPSGFKDLDEITGGFQPGNLIVLAARPSMGKCLESGALISDPTNGRRRRIEDVVAAHEAGEEIWVEALGPDLRLRPARVSAALRSGRQQIFRLRTRLGRRVGATATHPILTMGGWKRLDELCPGDRIAVPRVAQLRGRAPALPDHDLVKVVGKEDREDSLPADVLKQRVSTNVDTVPAEVWPQVLATKGAGPWADVSEATGRPRNHNWHVGSRGLSRSLLGELADAFDDEALDLLATSEIWWDEVASIEPIGEDETYDLTVPGLHNFVADDVIVHNSALVTNMAENAALDHGRPVALFSLEMSEAELSQRFLASQARIKGEDLRKGRLTETKWPKILAASERLSRAPLYVDDSSDVGIMEVRAKARRLHSQTPGGLGLVIVDYLQLMRADERIESRVQQVGQMSRGLKILARELDVPVIALSQLSRAVEQRGGEKIPILSDLRESGNLEQDADAVIFIYREEYYEKDSEREGEADLIIAKHRNGPIGRVVLTFHKEYPKFMNFAGERFT